MAGASGFERIMNGLVRAHGIFMLIAWLLLVQVAVHFAWYMRPALPNGEWFQVHRALMIIALFLSLLGFILIFISQARSSTPGLVDLSDVCMCMYTMCLVCCVCIYSATGLKSTFFTFWHFG